MGKREDREVETALGALVERLAPDLVVASGDLTHRGRRDQHERAAAFLRGLGRPVVAVPGNHDIPYTFPARFSKPWAEFERLWETTEPVHAADGLLVVGLNSVRPWRHQSGGVRDAQLRWAAEQLAAAPAGALRVVAMHHQLIGAPVADAEASGRAPERRARRAARRRRRARSSPATPTRARSPSVTSSRPGPEQPGVTIATAPGFGQPRPYRRGEARGLLVYEAEERELRAHTYIWRDGDWGLTATRRYPRGTDALVEG